jgi:hypothetical protein
MGKTKEFTKLKNVESTFIGAQLVIDNDLWYVERYSEYETHGYLKKVNLISGKIHQIERLPMVGSIYTYIQPNVLFFSVERPNHEGYK